MSHYIKVHIEDLNSDARLKDYIQKTFPDNSKNVHYWLEEDDFEKDQTYTFITENDAIALFARLGFEGLEGIEILENKIISSDESS